MNPDDEKQAAEQQPADQPQQPIDNTPIDQQPVENVIPTEHDAPAAPTIPVAPQIPVAASVAPEPAPARRKNRTPLIAISIATAAVLGIGGLGTAAVAILTRPTTSTTSTTQTPNRNAFGQFPGGVQLPGQSQGGFGGQSQSGTGTSTVTDATASTSAEKIGVVTINTVLNYDTRSQAAGTGMILSSDGLILTNNHVIEESTKITVTVESTGKTYNAVVVGTDATADVAVIKLVGASGLTPVTMNASEKVAVGDVIHSVGNAEGTGDLVTASGTVSGVNKKLTVSSDFSSSGESLTGLIELNSDVVSGDSGGPLFDKSGDVIGIVTAASTGGASVTGYAINIASVLSVVEEIESGTASSDVVIGTPAFLGDGISSTVTSTKGVPIGSVYAGFPGAKAGIKAGSVITKVNGKSVTTAAGLSAAIHANKVGDKVTITWITAKGNTLSAPVTLVAGPAA